MLFQGKVITAGPRGNSCKTCREKTKAPDVILKVVGEFIRHVGFPKMEIYCPKCGAEALEITIAKLKEMVEVLKNGPSDDSQLGSHKTRIV